MRQCIRRFWASAQLSTDRTVALLVCLTVWVLLNGAPAEAKRKQTPVVPADLNILSVAVSPESFAPGEGTVTFTIEVELPKELAGSTLLEVSSLISSPSKSSLRFLISRQPVGPGGVAAGPPPAQVGVGGVPSGPPSTQVGPGGESAGPPPGEKGPGGGRGPVAEPGATDVGDETANRPGPVAHVPAPPTPSAEQALGGARTDADTSPSPLREPVITPEAPSVGEAASGATAGGPSPAPDESLGEPEREAPESRDDRITITLTWDGNDQTGQRVQQGRFDYEVRAKLLVVGENGPRTQMVSYPKRGTIEVK